MTFGQIISEARKRRGLSQKELASRIKKEDGEAISPPYLNDIERDRRNPPSEQLITQFAEVLDLPKDFLILAAGFIPESWTEDIRQKNPKVIEKYAQLFRRKIRVHG